MQRSVLKMIQKHHHLLSLRQKAQQLVFNMFPDMQNKEGMLHSGKLTKLEIMLLPSNSKGAILLLKMLHFLRSQC